MYAFEINIAFFFYFAVHQINLVCFNFETFELEHSFPNI
jgi:hypothetical protein